MLGHEVGEGWLTFREGVLLVAVGPRAREQVLAFVGFFGGLYADLGRHPLMGTLATTQGTAGYGDDGRLA